LPFNAIFPVRCRVGCVSRINFKKYLCKNCICALIFQEHGQ
jgi:hypothetical protein